MRVFLFGLGMVAAVGLMGCEANPKPTPINELKPRELHGYTVFQSRCGVCHYDRKDGTRHGPALVGLYKKRALPSGAAATDERVTATIQHGRGMMPAMGDTIDPQDLDDLLMYLHTL
ncbi:cytochrome c [Granulicella sp. dw_53]|uniref:c-type cytochrome n=1 Tax=Granulicella sp. dw_53 TaxID=2719792 RepID=UPI0031F6F466